MKLGIMGRGVVGSALLEYYNGCGHQVWSYDKAHDTPESLQELNRNAEVVFICVGTPYDEQNGGLDCSAVYEAVDALEGEKTVIIKSTVMPGTTDAVQEKHPEHDVYFVPEFLSENTAAFDYAHPNRRTVIGYSEKVWPFGSGIALLVSGDDVCRSHIIARDAELLKLARNSFLANKVCFANLLYDAGMSQNALDALCKDDPWIGEGHFTVEHKGYRGFGGACLPKDTRALYDLTKHPILGAVLEYNDELTTKVD